jgi:uncharacterized protein YegL
VGFSIGGHRRKEPKNYRVHNLSRYTIGVWTLAPPGVFKTNVQTLTLRLFGGNGCYLANRDTVDIFPQVIGLFDRSSKASRVLVIVSDQMGKTEGLHDIVAMLKDASVTAHVVGIPGADGAHESIARLTGGKFWNIRHSKGHQDFGYLLATIGDAIGKELTKRLSDGAISRGTDLGAALRMVAGQLKMPPMTTRGLPPVLVLVSDGKPTDTYQEGLKMLMNQPWGKKSVRIAIAIGRDADREKLWEFIGHPELRPLEANNPESLVKYIKWASTAVLKSATSPPSQLAGTRAVSGNVAIPALPVRDGSTTSGKDVW